MRMASRAVRTKTGASAGLENATGDGGAEFGFKSGQARREQLAPGHNDDIEARRDVISTENLSNQTLSAIPDYRATEPLRSGDAEPADRQPIRLRKQRVVAARNTRAMLVDVLKIGVFTDPLVRAEFQTVIRC